MPVVKVFTKCVQAIQSNKLIRRVSRQDKEFHFQNWFRDRLEETGLFFDSGGRNTYPDFTLVHFAEGYEIKGLAYPGRDTTYDANSQVPSGFHNGRTIYYVFGRYPKDPDGDTYPVLDLVICHGDFLNADHEYTHKNRSVKGFGSYGDIMIRDRKMYVVPTPFHLIDGVAHYQTLVLPSDINPGDDFLKVGELLRTEAAELIVAYKFDLKTNTINAEKIANPTAGKQHLFYAWRLRGSPSTEVAMRRVNLADLEEFQEDADGE
ncbi:MAG: hypothetical protein QXZ09_06865 [Candidatus Methanomethylicaceae archaeon]